MKLGRVPCSLAAANCSEPHLEALTGWRTWIEHGYWKLANWTQRRYGEAGVGAVSGLWELRGKEETSWLSLGSPLLSLHRLEERPTETGAPYACMHMRTCPQVCARDAASHYLKR